MLQEQTQHIFKHQLKKTKHVFFSKLQGTYRHFSLVRLISGHQKVMDLLIIHFKVAHLYMAFALKYINPNRSANLLNGRQNSFAFSLLLRLFTLFKYEISPFHFSLRPVEKKAPQKTVVLHLLLL